jgi:Neuraminidase (sialidase)
MKPTSFLLIILITFISLTQNTLAENTNEKPQVTLTLPPSPDNLRNSEGDLIELKDGRILLVYTHFTAGAGDHANAFLAGRFSKDHGQTWTKADTTVIPNEGGMNIMSVSLLRLQDGRIALFYLRKNSTEDCRPVMRISTDEAKTWSDPVETIPDSQVGYYVMNNDRAFQMKNGRLLLPLSQHYGSDWEKWTAYGKAVCYTSDDAGKTWQRGEQVPQNETSLGDLAMIQEPGLVELQDGQLMMFARTNAGSQYLSYSKDKGETWSDWAPSDISSPRSPATIERIPSTGDLLLVWNNHRDIDPSLKGKRTPLTAAISTDDGKSWKHVKNLFDNPNGWYCYTAMLFVGDHVLLEHCAGDRTQNNGLALSQVTRVPIAWLYAE